MNRPNYRDAECCACCKYAIYESYEFAPYCDINKDFPRTGDMNENWRIVGCTTELGRNRVGEHDVCDNFEESA